MFLKYDLKDTVNNQTFKGFCNLNNVLEIIRVEWPNQDNQTIRIIYSSCNTPLFSSNKERVEEVYNELCNLIRQNKLGGVHNVVIPGNGVMEIL